MIDKKLLTLQEQGVISASAAAFVMQVAKRLQEQHILRQDEVAWMFLAHLATAYMRQLQNQLIEALPQMVKEEVEQNSLYEQALLLWSKLDQGSGIRWQANELDYIVAHLMALLTKDN